MYKMRASKGCQVAATHSRSVPTSMVRQSTVANSPSNRVRMKPGLGRRGDKCEQLIGVRVDQLLKIAEDGVA
jgi:hypothetical protein